ncbi:MAG: D-amino acid dehydrogenase [Pseudomonadota bacterium]
MKSIAIIGAGITGVTTAYALATRGYRVTVFDRHRYPAMETSFANGGQLSASNAEVWNNLSTIKSGMRWLLKADAPLALNPSPSLHKYSWFAEFVAAIRHHHNNTRETVRLALMARQRLFELAETENIDFNLEKRGILHFYKTNADFQKASRTNQLLVEAGLEREAVTAEEIRQLEPALRGDLVGGYYTAGDATGDIHKFTCGLAEACVERGVRFQLNTEVLGTAARAADVEISWREAGAEGTKGGLERAERNAFDGVAVCAGVASPKFAKQLGDRVNIYPVKGYSITVDVPENADRSTAPWVSLLDESAKIVTSRLGQRRYRVAGTAEFNGFNRDIRHDRVRPLIEWVEQHHPHLSTEQVTPWAGLRPMTPTMMPRVGRGKSPHVFYNTGHGHLGWTLSAATAEMVASKIDQAFVDEHERNIVAIGYNAVPT